MIRMSLPTLLPALALGLAAPALAETATIKVHDLDLSTEAGQATLEARTEAAARWLCADVELTGTRIRDLKGRETCMASVRQQAARKVAARESAGKAGG